MIDVLAGIRRPAYTGANRCWPCTIVNGVLLAAGVSVLVAFGWVVPGALLGIVGVVGIALRGYLIPYTPRFAPTLVSLLPVNPFDHDEDSTAGLDDGMDESAAPSGEDVVRTLLDAGVVVPQGEDLVLDESFREEWTAQQATLRAHDLEDLESVADRATPASIEVSTTDDPSGPKLRLAGPDGLPSSLPLPVAIAELATVRALEPIVDDELVRLAAGRPMRPFLDRCPACETDLTVSQQACCGEVVPIGSTPAEKLLCPNCDVRLFTYE